MTAMPESLSIERTTDDTGRVVLALSGFLGGDSDLCAVGAGLGAPLTVDLGGIQLINSEGVRDWVKFLRGALGRGPVILRSCSEPMVTLFNMATVAVSGTTIESVLCPYECGGCEMEEMRLLSVEGDLANGGVSTLPAFPCATCGGSLAFAGIADRYFAFLEPA
jgi:hypothetical protein